MGFNDILKSLFGNKSDRDLKELLPIASKVNVEWEKIKGVSHDELRQISADLKAKIHAHVKEEEDEIASLKAKVENEKPSIEEREEIYNRIDKLEEQINTKLEILNDEFQHVHQYNPIEHIKSRIKTSESIVKKLRRHGYESTIENMVKYVNDIAGIRVICSFTSDIYRIA